MLIINKYPLQTLWRPSGLTGVLCLGSFCAHRSSACCVSSVGSWPLTRQGQFKLFSGGASKFVLLSSLGLIFLVWFKLLLANVIVSKFFFMALIFWLFVCTSCLISFAGFLFSGGLSHIASVGRGRSSGAAWGPLPSHSGLQSAFFLSWKFGDGSGTLCEVLLTLLSL